MYCMIVYFLQHTLRMLFLTKCLESYPFIWIYEELVSRSKVRHVLKCFNTVFQFQDGSCLITWAGSLLLPEQHCRFSSSRPIGPSLVFYSILPLLLSKQTRNHSSCRRWHFSRIEKQRTKLVAVFLSYLPFFLKYYIEKKFEKKKSIPMRIPALNWGSHDNQMYV